ncbi:flavin reductase family protein [uncultured Bacteroides sp.]|uniref:flavin reductase family protein n=1 Tax=uncultured Bacteroides sp. TaxID=162156 RepID=UPI0025917F67|nr:flavin reductase family protein [uncultured Bacteroides sp.]
MKKNLGNTPVVAPLPVLIVATYDEQGTPNAMNAAWGGQCGYHHVALNLALGHKTTENLKNKKVFTLSIANVETLVLSDYFGLVSGRKENKIEKAGVHVTHSEFVDAPVIDEYPLTLEYKVVEMQEALGEMHVVGEVVNVQADESILNTQGKVDLGKLQPISFDSVSRSYRVLGGVVGKAFKDGIQLH